MNNVEWILIDTETNGLKAPIYAFDIGAQLMRGWEGTPPLFNLPQSRGQASAFHAAMKI